MVITQAKQTEDSNWVRLTFDDDSTGQVSVEDGINRQYTILYNEFLASGGVLEPQYTQAELDAQAEAKRILDIKTSCRTQIYAMYDAEDQMNATAEAALTTDTVRKAELATIFAWVQSMVGLSRAAVLDGVTQESDIVWTEHIKVSL